MNYTIIIIMFYTIKKGVFVLCGSFDTCMPPPAITALVAEQ
jgi:hypothetical protein